MAVSEELTKVVMNNLLDNGTTATGSVRTVSVSLGTMNPTAFDNNKAVNIVNALVPVLSKSLYKLNKVATYDITTTD